jgi:hypothetical protein
MRRYGFHVDMSKPNNPFIDIRLEPGVPAVIEADRAMDFRALALAVLFRAGSSGRNEDLRGPTLAKSCTGPESAH